MPSLPFLFIAAFYTFTLNPVTLSIYPPFAMPPATFRITVLAPRHADNRALCFGVDGPELKRSCFTLEGESSRRVWTVYWELRTAGEYMAQADLTRVQLGHDRHYFDMRPFRVLGGEP